MMERQKKLEFKKFRKRNFRLLVVGTLIVMICQVFVPMIPLPRRIDAVLNNSLTVFSWVLLWRPIDRLLFHWNSFLKEISLFHKMANAVIIRIKANDMLLQHKDDLMALQKTMIRA